MSVTIGGPDALPARAGVSLRTRFLLIGLLIFVVGAAASYTVIGWFSRDVVQTLSGWFAEKSVLQQGRNRVMLADEQAAPAERSA